MGREVTLAYVLRDWGWGVNRAPLFVLSFTLQRSKIADARGSESECWEQFVLSISLPVLESLSAVIDRALMRR